MRIGGRFLALCRCFFSLLFAGLRGVLPEVAANKMLFTLFDALTLFLPVVERVQLVGCKHDFDIGHGGGLFVAVLVGGFASGGNGGDLVRGVVRGGDGVQGGRVKPGGFVADDLIVRHGKYFLSIFVVVLPGGAGWMGSGRFSVRPVKVSGGDHARSSAAAV